MPNDFNRPIIDEFRANGGRVGGYFAGARLLLLTTTGRTTGAAHTTPVGHLPDGGGRFLVIASAGGAPQHPDWYRNLVADPRVTVEDGVFTYQARAVVLEGPERDAIFARAVDADPGWAAYQEKTDRVLPVVALHPEPGPPGSDATPGAHLKAVHDAFRHELALVRAEVARSGPGIGAQLRLNCLTVCAGLEFHHNVEDTVVFPHLAAGHPGLAAPLQRLRDEHTTIAALLSELRAVLSTDDTTPERVLPEVDRLIADLETHLTYEEERLIPLLDAG